MFARNRLHPPKVEDPVVSKKHNVLISITQILIVRSALQPISHRRMSEKRSGSLVFLVLLILSLDLFEVALRTPRT